MRTKIRILEATVMTVVKYSSWPWALRKTEEDLLDVAPEKFPTDCFGYPVD